ncbi:hypothetical protein TUM17378_14710 [Shewanella algae]|nr:hypothetical protein TUM17378_14710 [Shewanella algae]
MKCKIKITIIRAQYIIPTSSDPSNKIYKWIESKNQKQTNKSKLKIAKTLLFNINYGVIYDKQNKENATPSLDNIYQKAKKNNKISKNCSMTHRTKIQ